MKKPLSYLLFIFLIVSCKEKETYNYLTFINAGHEDGLGIRYVDIEPDDTLTITSYPDSLEMIRSLDLDDDNVPDFELRYSVSTPYMLGLGGSDLKIIPLGMNFICVSNIESHWVDSLKYLDTIRANNNWSDSTALLYSYEWMLNGREIFKDTSGYWFQNSDFYVGVKIAKGENSLYGWIDVNRNIIRRYAVTIPY